MYVPDHDVAAWLTAIENRSDGAPGALSDLPPAVADVVRDMRRTLSIRGWVFDPVGKRWTEAAAEPAWSRTRR